MQHLHHLHLAPGDLQESKLLSYLQDFDSNLVCLRSCSRAVSHGTCSSACLLPGEASAAISFFFGGPVEALSTGVHCSHTIQIDLDALQFSQSCFAGELVGKSVHVGIVLGLQGLHIGHLASTPFQIRFLGDQWLNGSDPVVCVRVM